MIYIYITYIYIYSKNHLQADETYDTYDTYVYIYIYE
jgi:hypothetical protein